MITSTDIRTIRKRKAKQKEKRVRGRGWGKDVEYNGAMEQMFFKSGERSGSKNLIKAAARRRSHRRV